MIESIYKLNKYTSFSFEGLLCFKILYESEYLSGGSYFPCVYIELEYDRKTLKCFIDKGHACSSTCCEDEANKIINKYSKKITDAWKVYKGKHCLNMVDKYLSRY